MVARIQTISACVKRGFSKKMLIFNRRRAGQAVTGEVWTAISTRPGFEDVLSNLSSSCSHAQTEPTCYTQRLEGKHSI